MPVRPEPIAGTTTGLAKYIDSASWLNLTCGINHFPPGKMSEKSSVLHSGNMGNRGYVCGTHQSPPNSP